MNLFSNTFLKYKINISQILLTLEDTETRRRSLNAKRTFENLFDLNFIPIVNENDTIATTEIKYGDNDRLASRVAQITNADILVLLSDVNGLYTKNPKLFIDAKLIKKVENIYEDLKNINLKGSNEFGSGGMNTKIEAAKICQLSGCNMIIANGLHINPIDKIMKLKFNHKLVKYVIDWQLNHQKPRTAKTKQRNEIRGSTKKIYAQKGTGQARHASKKAPLFVGGGQAHGPKGAVYKIKKN